MPLPVPLSIGLNGRWRGVSGSREVVFSRNEGVENRIFQKVAAEIYTD